MNRKLLGALAAGWLLAGLALPAWAQQESQTPSGQEEIIIPEGTEFKLQLHTTINSKTSKPGDRLLTTLIDPVAVEDRDILPKGLRIDGHLGDVKPAGRRGKGGFMVMAFDTIELPNGQKVDIRGSLTEIFASEGGGDPNVGTEGELKGHGASKKVQVAIIAAAGGLGAVGGLAPGIVAGSAGTAAALVLVRGKQAALAAGSLIGMRLDQDVSITLPPSGK